MTIRKKKSRRSLARLTPECLAEPMRMSPTAMDRALQSIFRGALVAGAAVAIGTAPGCDEPLPNEQVHLVDADVSQPDATDSSGDVTGDFVADTPPDNDVIVEDVFDVPPPPDVVDIIEPDWFDDVPGDVSDPIEKLWEQCPELEPAAADMGVSEILALMGGDYVALYQGEFFGGNNTLPPAFEAGIPCATATTNQCALELSRIAESAASATLVWTGGDGVLVARTPEEFVDRFGLRSTAHATAFFYLSSYFGTVEAVAAVNSGYKAIYTGTDSCLDQVWAYLVHASPQGVTTVLDQVLVSESGGCVGRMPAGLSSDGILASTGHPLGQYFANTAYLEAAAVVAFENLAVELEAFGAPGSLVAAARAAAADEVVHAEMTTALARRFGVEPRVPEQVGVPQRSLEEFAIDNAVEGCVRETFGAVVGCHQGAHSSDPEIAAAMQRIGEDETRHAALSWRMAAWLDTVLDADARLRVLQAQRAAIDLFRARVRREPSDLARNVAGVPSAAQASAMFDALENSLWATTGA